jgi:alkylation response protein AidB-like acyl-CoA dehydrogenase
MTADASGFALSAEQLELRASVRSLLELKSSEADVRAIMETAEGYDPQLWRQMAEQLGLHGLAIPEEFGGHGFGFTELGVVLEEMGRALLPGPFFASAVLAAAVLMQCDDLEAQKRYLPGIASGERIATLALTEMAGLWNVDAVAATGRRRAGTWRLNGTKTFVPDGHVADLMLVVARTEAGPSLFAVDHPERINRRPLSTLDSTRRQARVEFSDTAAELIGAEGRARPKLARALDIAAAGLAAEQVGGAQRCLDMAVDYAKTRKQFGKPIGSFQAIRHMCADLMLDIECARGAAQYAARAATDLSDELPAAASLAKACCSDAYVRAASRNIQIHGGIGFTWEHPAHMYYKRAQSSGMLLGDADYHRGLLADRIGI